MTSKPIFPAAVLAALMLTASPGVAWADGGPCTVSDGPGMYNRSGIHGCVEDVPPFIARHAQQDPFGRAPFFSAGGGGSAKVGGREFWFQDGLAHRGSWYVRESGEAWVYYEIHGSNDDDTVRLKKYRRQWPDVKAMRVADSVVVWPPGPDIEFHDWTGYPAKPAMGTNGIIFYAGSGTDTVYGTIGPDIITSWRGGYREYGCWESTAQKECEALGLRGTKTYYGKGGDDRLSGGRDDDWLYGGTGDDILWGGPGRDRLYGGPGNDYLYGGPGRDRLYGGPGSDYLDGGPGRDRLYGGPGNDYLDGGPGNDVLAGGEGSDFMMGDGGRDTYILPNIADRGRDRDVILADRADDITSQPFWRHARRISIDDVTMPDIQIGHTRYRLSHADASLEDFAHRVPGADIIYRVAGDPTSPPPSLPPPLPPPALDPDSDRRIDREDRYTRPDPEDPYIPYTDPYIDSEDPYTVSGS